METAKLRLNREARKPEAWNSHYGYSYRSFNNSVVSRLHASIFPWRIAHVPISGRAIRLVRLPSAAKLTDPLICDIVVNDLDKPKPDREPYVALSYAWDRCHADGRHLTHELIWAGSKLRITATIDGALRQLRAHSGSIGLPQTYVWFDLICIDQRNHVERDQQISLMSQIFSKADRLVIWLGSFDSETERQQWRDLLLNCDSIYDDHSTHTLNFEEHKLCMRPTRRMMEACIQKSWFRRRWVIQEYVLAPPNQRFVQIDDVVICDSLFRSYLQQHGLLDASGPMRLAAGSDRENTLLQNLHIHSGARCKLDKDMAVALWSLSKAGSYERLNYSGHDILSKTAYFFIHGDRPRLSTKSDLLLQERAFKTLETLQILVSATARHSEEDLWPSWLPDWSQYPTYTSPEHRLAVENTLALKTHVELPLRVVTSWKSSWSDMGDCWEQEPRKSGERRVNLRRIAMDGTFWPVHDILQRLQHCSAELREELTRSAEERQMIFVPLGSKIGFAVTRWEDTILKGRLRYCFELDVSDAPRRSSCITFV